MKKLFLYLFVMLNLFQQPSIAQTKKMDSLNLALQNAKQDTTRLRIYSALGNECDAKDNILYAEPAIKLAEKMIAETKNDSLKKVYLKYKAYELLLYAVYYQSKEGLGSIKQLEYFEQQLKIYKQIEDKDGIKTAFINIADFYYRIGNYERQLHYFQEGLSWAKKINYLNGQSRFIVQIANLYADQGDTVQALGYIQKGADLEKKIGDSTRIARGLVILGDFYRKLLRYPQALETYYKAIPLYEAQKDDNSLSNIYLQIGRCYKEKGNFPKALENFQKCFSLSEKINSTFGKTTTLRLIGDIYRKQNEISKAIEYHTKALKQVGVENNAEPMAYAYQSLAKDYLLKKDYKMAKGYSEGALQIMKQFSVPDNIRDAENLAAQVDSLGGNYKDAFHHYKNYINLRDKLNSKEVHQAAQREKFQSEYDKQKAIDKAISDNEIEKQKIVRNSFIGGFALMILLAGVSYRNFRRKKNDNLIIGKQKHLVEEKNREITQSIEYALRIQTAILPPQKIVKQYLENSFILYKPKDIVAGDFYWMETGQLDNLKMSKFENEEQSGTAFSNFQIDKFSNWILFAACDCTGHGVPGAMVSVVCHNALNRAVREFGLTQPSLILDKTAEIVIENFSKSEENIKDGMDISLCAYNTKTKELQWAGANNPLWLFQNGKLIETKADKQPIGMNEDSKPFTNHSFTLNTGDSIYLFTDGFADQFGGDTGEKKLTKKRFKEVILSVQNKSMQEQGIELDKFIIDYRKEIEQIDDILVMGVKI